MKHPIRSKTINFNTVVIAVAAASAAALEYAQDHAPELITGLGPRRAALLGMVITMVASFVNIILRAMTVEPLAFGSGEEEANAP